MNEASILGECVLMQISTQSYVTKRSCKHALVTVLYQLRQDGSGTNMPLFRVNSLINIQKHK